MGEGKKNDVRQEQSTYSGDVTLMSRNKYIIERDRGPGIRKELYKVKDETGNTLCLAERPKVFYKIISASGFLLILGFSVIPITSLGLHSALVNFILLSICIALIALAVILLKPRHLFVFRSEIDHQQILRIIHCKVYRLFIGTYMIESAVGELLGYLRINRVLKIWRAQMKCYRPDGSLMCTIVESRPDSRVVLVLIESIFYSFAKRSIDYLNVIEPTESRVIGKFSGRNIMELAPEAAIDGRICLAMGLMICSELGSV